MQSQVFKHHTSLQIFAMSLRLLEHGWCLTAICISFHAELPLRKFSYYRVVQCCCCFLSFLFTFPKSIVLVLFSPSWRSSFWSLNWRRLYQKSISPFCRPIWFKAVWVPLSPTPSSLLGNWKKEVACAAYKVCMCAQEGRRYVCFFYTRLEETDSRSSL